MEGEEAKHVYHEKQRLQFCLMHALNNLLQEESFTRAELDVIAEKLVLDDPIKDKWTPISLIFKPHHNTLTGNYDVNVLIAALEARGKGVVWHDRRSGASSIRLAEETLLGIMLNIPVRKFGLWRGNSSMKVGLGELWELMISLLSDDLPFTVFSPSEVLSSTFCSSEPVSALWKIKRHNTVVIPSRVMGFSAIPRHLSSLLLTMLKEISFDCIWAHIICLKVLLMGSMIVNNVRSERVDVMKGETIVHVMDGGNNGC